MTETVRWVQVVKHLYEQGVLTLVEVGPGAVLSGLVRRASAQRAAFSFELALFFRAPKAWFFT